MEGGKIPSLSLQGCPEAGQPVWSGHSVADTEQMAETESTYSRNGIWALHWVSHYHSFSPCIFTGQVPCTRDCAGGSIVNGTGRFQTYGDFVLTEDLDSKQLTNLYFNESCDKHNRGRYGVSVKASLRKWCLNWTLKAVTRREGWGMAHGKAWGGKNMTQIEMRWMSPKHRRQREKWLEMKLVE